MKRTNIYIIIILSLLAFAYSCEKKEPAVQPEPSEIMAKITEQFQVNKANYDSREKSKELSSAEAAELYSEEKNKPVDLSKIEKYSIIKSEENSEVEIGIFKLYDKVNAEYVKDMAQNRILKLQESANIKVYNDAEIRSYGNYVYYVSHPQKDRIFEIIEDTLRGV